MQSQFFYYTFIFFIFLSFSTSVQGAGMYKVVKVKSWDTLNMRSGPGVKNGVVTKIPHNATGIQLAGGARKVGKTNWVEVNWQGKRGWVSKSYISQQSTTAVAPSTPSQPNRNADSVDLMISPPQPAQTTVQEKKPEKPEPNYAGIIKNKKSGMWILECGNASPFWKVEVLPEWLRGTLGKHKTGMPITHKRQEHGKYHKVALETEVRGSNKWNKLRMTLRYTKSCRSSLTKRREAFSVKGWFNSEEIKGCCRSYQVK